MDVAPVYRAVLPRDLVAGLPRHIFFSLLGLTVFVAIGLSQLWFLGIAVIAFFTMRILTKHDEYLIEISIGAFFTDPDFFEV